MAAKTRKKAPVPVPFTAQFYRVAGDTDWNCKVMVKGKLAGFATMPTVDEAFALAHQDADERGLLVEQA